MCLCDSRLDRVCRWGRWTSKQCKGKQNGKKFFYLLIFYYDFCPETEIDSIVKKIKDEASKARKKIKITQIKKAGEIAPYKFRFRVDFKII